MKDFNSFVSDDNANSKKNATEKGASPFDMFATLSSKYEGKSADDVMMQILKEAEKGRRNGTLSDQDIDNFASKVAPLLNDKQRKMLSTIVARLKSIK